MNKDLNKINTIIVIVIIVVSIVVISNNFVKDLQNKYYLKANSKNREYIEELVSINYKLTGQLNKVAYMQGLGDWDLFIYYKDGTEDRTTFGDSDKEAQRLQEYIIKNGYNEGKASLNKITISFWAIISAIIYEVIYLIRKKIKSKLKEEQYLEN